MSRPASTRSPRVVELAVAKGPAFPAGRMLISSPEEIARVVAAIPAGRLLTLGALRAHLAALHRADYTCPLTTGIFLRLVAEEAEAASAGAALPWWRVVRDDGRLLDRLPGGADGQARRLRAEGHAPERRGRCWRLDLPEGARRPPLRSSR